MDAVNGCFETGLVVCDVKCRTQAFKYVCRSTGVLGGGTFSQEVPLDDFRHCDGMDNVLMEMCLDSEAPRGTQPPHHDSDDLLVSEARLGEGGMSESSDVIEPTTSRIDSLRAPTFRRALMMLRRRAANGPWKSMRLTRPPMSEAIRLVEAAYAVPNTSKVTTRESSIFTTGV